MGDPYSEVLTAPSSACYRRSVQHWAWIQERRSSWMTLTWRWGQHRGFSGPHATKTWMVSLCWSLCCSGAQADASQLWWPRSTHSTITWEALPGRQQHHQYHTHHQKQAAKKGQDQTRHLKHARHPPLDGCGGTANNTNTKRNPLSLRRHLQRRQMPLASVTQSQTFAFIPAAVLGSVGAAGTANVIDCPPRWY